MAGGIAKSARLGIILQMDIGRALASFFRAGGSYTQAVQYFEINSEHKVGHTIAWNGVRLAISGHPGICGVDAYEGLIKDESERKKLASQHRKNYSKKTFKERTGIHGLGHKERVENLNLATEGRGQTPWSEDETRYTYESSQQPKYRNGKLLKAKELAEDVNNHYHDSQPIRNSNAVQMAIKRYKTNLLKLL